MNFLSYSQCFLAIFLYLLHACCLSLYSSWELPLVVKSFVPSDRCPNCGHANDVDFRFCQCCGYNRKRSPPKPTVLPDVDLIALDNRLQQLTNYVRQKNSLQNELQLFLAALPGSPTLATATPRDLCRFLIYKDRNGKT